MTAAIVAAAVRKAGTWLLKRSANVSKHVALHQGQAIKQVTRPWVMSKAAHSVFRGANPKKLIQKALKNFDRSVVQASRRAGKAGHVVIEKDFGRRIGRNGEKILKVVIDQATGRIVTAFPVHEFTVAASGVGLALLTTIVTEAVEEADATVEGMAQAKERREANRTFGVKLLEFVIDLLLDPGVAGENEDMMLAVDAIHARKLKELEAAVSEERMQSLTPAVTENLRQQYFDAVAGVVSVDVES